MNGLCPLSAVLLLLTAQLQRLLSLVAKKDSEVILERRNKHGRELLLKCHGRKAASMCQHGVCIDHRLMVREAEARAVSTPLEGALDAF